MLNLFKNRLLAWGNSMNAFKKMKRVHVLIFVFVLAVIVQLSDPLLLGQTTFTDVRSTCGVFTKYIGPHGVFFADANEDGKVDLYITTYASGYVNSADHYYINTSTGGVITYVSKAGAIRDYDGGSHGACWADLDNDGDFDLINGGTILDKTITPASNWTAGYNDIFENTQVAGRDTFLNVTPAVMTISDSLKKTRAVTAFDKENDGFLDIFCVSGYLGSSEVGTATGHPNEFYDNTDGTFANLANIPTGALKSAPSGQGCVDTDYDNDGYVDMITANRTGDICVLNNNGDGTFTSIPNTTHGITHPAKEGISMADFDNDGDLDMITLSPGDDSYNKPNEGIARQYENKTYHETSPQVGVFGSQGVDWENVDGYMAALGDVDNDGDVDMIIGGCDTLFVNVDGLFDDGDFVSIDPSMGNMADPRGIAFADMDNDGDLDFAVSAKDSMTYVYQNNLSSSNHYLKVRLFAPNGQAGAFGSKVYVTPVNQAGIHAKRQGGLPQIGLREARGNYGYLGQNDPTLHFGLGASTAVDVTVEYIDGYRATRRNVAADQTITINRADVRVAVKIYLEGCYDATGDTMTTDMNGPEYIPTTSPHLDLREIVEIPTDDIVDWVYVKLRDESTMAYVDSTSALLRNDGMVVADDGVTEYITMNAESDNYYIEVDHRNHVSVMSATAHPMDYTSSTVYDFTDNSNKYYGTLGCKSLGGSKWGMITGDANGNGEVQADDKENDWRTQVGLNGYRSADFNLNGQVQADDKENYWRLNAGLGSKVP